jgi:hypothetical protein
MYSYSNLITYLKMSLSSYTLFTQANKLLINFMYQTQISLEQIFICVVLFFLCLVILSVQITIYIVYTQ